MKVAITEEIIARQPPEAQAIIRMLLAQIAEFMYVCGQGQSRSKDPPGGTSLQGIGRRCPPHLPLSLVPAPMSKPQ